MSFLAPSPSNLRRRPSVQEIREIFPSAIATGLILPELGQGLHVEFGKRANLLTELGMVRGSSSAYYSKKLYSLTMAFGFLNLKNCDVPQGVVSSSLSQGADGHGRFLQDPFHRDCNAVGARYVTVMLRADVEGGKGREEPTFYAPEADVKDAIRQLKREGLHSLVVEALDKMGSRDYRFNLFDHAERRERDIIHRLYPEFTQHVYDLIPAGRKFTKTWQAGVADIAIHSNMPNSLLHARPTGHAVERSGYAVNVLRGLEIYHG